MQGSLGWPVSWFVLVFVMLLGWLVLLPPACLVCRKAGYPAWLGVAVVVPLFNVLLLYFLGLNRWPIEREVEELRALSGRSPAAPEPTIPT